MDNTIVIDTPNGIEMFRRLALKGRLSLECKGLKFRGRHTTYALIKMEFGLKGSKERVLAQYTEMCEGWIRNREEEIMMTDA